MSGEAYYDSILNPKKPKVEDEADLKKPKIEVDSDEEVPRRVKKVKPAPEEQYRSRSYKKNQSECVSGKRSGVVSLMDEYDKLLN